MPTSTPQTHSEIIPFLREIVEELDSVADVVAKAGSQKRADHLIAMAGVLERFIGQYRDATEDDAFIEMSRRAAFWRAAAIHHGASARSYRDYQEALDA